MTVRPVRIFQLPVDDRGGGINTMVKGVGRQHQLKSSPDEVRHRARVEWCAQQPSGRRAATRHSTAAGQFTAEPVAAVPETTRRRGVSPAAEFGQSSASTVEAGRPGRRLLASGVVQRSHARVSRKTTREVGTGVVIGGCQTVARVSGVVRNRAADGCR